MSACLPLVVPLAPPAPAVAAPAVAVSAPAAVAIARAEVGVAGSGRKCQPYGPLCTDWCAMFATWVWERAGVADVPRGEYIATALGLWGQRHGRYSARQPGTRGGTPRPGDMVIYGEPGRVLGGHVAIVSAVHADGTLTTVDGNFGNRVVEQRIDPLTSRAGAQNVLVSGYVHLPGATTAATSPHAATATATAAPAPRRGPAPELVALDGDGRLFGFRPADARQRKPRDRGRPGARGTVPWRDPVGDWSAATTLTRADIDGDRRPDLVTVRTDGSLTIHPHRPGAAPYGAPAVTIPGQWQQLRHLAAGDVTGDGRADLLAVDAAGGLVAFAHTGDATRPYTGQPAWRLADWLPTRQLLVTHLDADRRPDLVVAAADGTLHGFRQRATGPAFGAAAWRAQDTRWAGYRQLAVTDADGDRYGDLVAVAPQGDLVTIRQRPGGSGSPFRAESWYTPGPWLTTRALG